MKSPHDIAIDYLNSRNDWEQAKSIRYTERTFRIDRMWRLVELLGNPQESLKIVHVAGTKGKGSTTAMLASIFLAAGLKTGTFTSPHLQKIEERCAIDGRPCPEEIFAELIEQVRPAVEVVDREMPGDGPTYFEIVTAVALLYFVHEKVDVAVLEVGLGGRLDSTNVCQPAVSVITSISFDHTAQLGSTLSLIAAEKAGIIKPGIPVISGVLAPEAQEVIRRTCREHNATLIELATDFHVVSGGACPRVFLGGEAPPPASVSGGACPRAFLNSVFLGEQFDYHESSDTGTDYSKLQLGLLGRHQARNAAVAVATVHELRRQGWTIDELALREGLATARCPARVELFDGSPPVIIDGAHNGASIESLIETLDRSISAKRRHLLFATTMEKDLPSMLGPLVRAFDRIIFTRYTTNPRSVDPATLLQIAQAEKGSGSFCRNGPEGAAHKRCLTPFSPQLEVADDPIRAFQRLRLEAAPDDLICVTGSFFIATEVRQVLEPVRKPDFRSEGRWPQDDFR